MLGIFVLLYLLVFAVLFGYCSYHGEVDFGFTMLLWPLYIIAFILVIPAHFGNFMRRGRSKSSANR